MERTLQLKEFLDFDSLFTKMKLDILQKHAEGNSVSEDLVQTFLKLYTTIDQHLTRIGRKVVAVAQGSQSALQNENIAKILSMFESLFVVSDEGEPAKLIEFLD